MRDRRDDALLLAGEVDAGQRAEAEPASPVVEAVVPERLSDLDRADVARARQDLGGVQLLGRVELGVVDRSVGDPVGVGDGERRDGRDQPLRQRAADRHDLERRPGLVVQPDRVVARKPDARGIVGIDARPVGHREDRVGPRVEHDRRGIQRPVLLAGRRDHAVGVLLDRRVERQLDGLAGDGRRAGDRDRLAVRVEHRVLHTGRARELRVELVLDPAQAGAAGPDAAEDLRAEVVVRVDPPRVRCQADPGDAEGLDLLGARGGYLAREQRVVDRGCRLHQVALDRRDAAMQQRCELQRDARRVAHQLRRCRDVVGGLADREQRAVAVDDRAALRGDVDGRDVLRVRGAAELPGVQRGELERPRTGDCEQRGEDTQQPADSPLTERQG